MKKNLFLTTLISCLIAGNMTFAQSPSPTPGVVDEIVWIVGDEAILLSDVEAQYRAMQSQGQRINGDPYCVIPEQIAIQKLFLTQARLDSVFVTESEVFSNVEQRINTWINSIGSKEKVEEYFNATIPQLREELSSTVRDQLTVSAMQRKLVAEVKVSPADVRRFYASYSTDSLPYIPVQVEVQLIRVDPLIPQQEIDDIKAKNSKISVTYILSEQKREGYEYGLIDEEKLFDNLVYFLKAIMPVCDKYDINMAIHPDDPSWSVFGLPRIISTQEKLKRMMDAVPNKHNGVTFCMGSYGTNLNNDLIETIKMLKGRIHFAHVRNLRFNDGMRDFEESAHLSADGTFDMYAVVKALYESGFEGPIRPDHGRMIWGEKAMPGYGLYDRALGAAYICGLWEAVEKQAKEAK